MADCLPQAVFIEILQRLPVKTLLRCTAVCKSWYSLITTPYFISSHLKFSAANKNKTPLLLLKRCRIKKAESYELFSDNESLSLKFTTDIPFRSTNSCFTIVGSCNGLLCLSDDHYMHTNVIILWNPYIEKSVLLPEPDISSLPYSTFRQTLGFGFDAVASDYKVVKITSTDYSPPRVDLYKLSTGVWKDISYLKFDYVIRDQSRQAYFNGATHWIARCTDLYDVIVLFDMSQEVFGKIMLPIRLGNDDPMISNDLMVYNESLAFVLMNVSGNVNPSFCLWVMKEYGVVESWSKHLSFDFYYFDNRRISRLLWIRRNGEVITVCEGGSLYSYDPNEVEVKHLGVLDSGYRHYEYSIHIDSYIKSLVLLDRGPGFADAVTRNKLMYNFDTISVWESD